MADQNVTSLVMAVDSTGVRRAEEDLKKMASAGNTAERSTSVLRQAMASTTSSTTSASAILAKAAIEAKKFGEVSKLSAHQAQQLSMQVQDLGVQIAGGGSIFTALVQQGSQVASTFGGIGTASRILASTINGTAVAVSSASAIIATFGAAYYQGSEQSKAFKNAILETGNAAGLTEGKFNSLIDRTADLTNSSKSAAREMALGFVQSGQLSGAALESTVTAALNISKATGASIEEIQKRLLAVTNGVANFAAAQNRTLGFLSSAQYRHIKALEEQGETGKAVMATMDALNERYRDQAQNLGLIERSWRDAKKAVSDYWEELKWVGRDLTLERKIEQNRQFIEMEGKSSDPAAMRAVAAKKAENEALQETLRLAGRQAQVQSESAEASKKGVEYSGVLARAYNRQQLAAKTLADAKLNLAKSDLTAAEQARVLAQLKKELDPGIGQALDQSKLADVKRNLDTVVAGYANAEAQLDALRQVGMVSDEAYYEAKILFVKRYERARIMALDAENAQLRDQSRSGDTMGAERETLLSRIRDNEAEILRIEAKASSDAEVLSTQRAAALRLSVKGYEEAKTAAEAYLQTLAKEQMISLALLGAGNEARSRESSKSQITGRYDEERRRIEAERASLQLQVGNLRPDQERQFTSLLALNEEYRAKALAGWKTYYSEMQTMQADWGTGAAEALANYVSDAKDASAQANRVFTNAARSMEDAIVTFATTGKLNFAQLASSIIADIIRVEAQRATSSIFSQILGYASSYFGSTAGSASAASSMSGDSLDNFLKLNNNFAGRAIGGPVAAGSVYQINERGVPEVGSFGGKDYLLTGGQSGTVKPASEAAAGPSFVFNVAPGVTRNELLSTLQSFKNQFAAEMTAKQRRTATIGGS